MDHAGYRVAKFCFLVADAVASHDCASGFDHLRQAAGQDALEDLDISLVGEADQSERGERLSAHGIDIAERIGGGDLAEDVWIVDDGGEEIHRLDERRLRRELIHASVVRSEEHTSELQSLR